LVFTLGLNEWVFFLEWLFCCTTFARGFRWSQLSLLLLWNATSSFFHALVVVAVPIAAASFLEYLRGNVCSRGCDLLCLSWWVP
jgi:hypothetical protein